MKSRLCEEGDCRRCGGGLVRDGGICSHSCHKRIGRPALQGPKREAARKRSAALKAAASPSLPI